MLGPAKKLCVFLWRVGRCEGVVPLTVEVVAFDGQGLDLLLGVSQAGGVIGGVQDAVDAQPGGCGRVGDQVDDDLVGA